MSTVDASGDSLSTDLDLHIEFGTAVSVYPNKGGEITLSISRVDEESDKIEREQVTIPYSVAQQIAETLIKLVDASQAGNEA